MDANGVLVPGQGIDSHEVPNSELSEERARSQLKELANTPLFQQVREFFDQLKVLMTDSRTFQLFKKECIRNGDNENYEESLTGIFRLL